MKQLSTDPGMGGGGTNGGRLGMPGMGILGGIGTGGIPGIGTGGIILPCRPGATATEEAEIFAD